MEKSIRVALAAGRNQWSKLFSEGELRALREKYILTVNEEPSDPSRERVAELARDAEVLISSWGCPQLDAELLERLPKLRLVLHAAGSVKGIASEALWARGIRVSGSASVLGRGVAETALGLTIASVKNLWSLSRSIAGGGWSEGYEDIREMYGLTIGVVGAGMAGAHYLELLSMFDVEKLVYDPFLPEEEIARRFGARKVSFEELLRAADLVSVHAPSIPETYHLFDGEAFLKMKRDAILINTARGSLIDEAALYRHMRGGFLRYACLDVTDPEPPAADNPLRTLPNCIMTPHLAGLTHNGLLRIGEHVCRELERYARNEALQTETDPAALSRSA